MYKHILIATDGSAVGDKAIEQGLEVAKRFGAKATIVKVTEMWSALDVAGRDALAKIETYERAAGEAAQAILQKAKSVAEKAGVACDTLHVPDRVPADGIVATADARGCDLIVMGSHGRRGINKLLLGSQAQNVLTQTKKPVLIAR
jgi:nucleotide-binding universal stress UspA family protein